MVFFQWIVSLHILEHGGLLFGNPWYEALVKMRYNHTYELDLEKPCPHWVGRRWSTECPGWTSFCIQYIKHDQARFGISHHWMSFWEGKAENVSVGLWVL